MRWDHYHLRSIVANLIKEGAMNSIGPIFRRQNVLRSAAAMFVVSLLCFASYQDTSAAQVGAASKAVSLLGKFAMGVLTGAASTIFAKEVEGKIYPEQKASPNNSSPLPKPPPEPQISGYKFTLWWQLPDQGVFSGTIKMRGVSGSFRVLTPDGILIDQKMNAELSTNKGEIFLIGSDPRYAPGSKRLENDIYYPDSFRLIQLPSGDWTITHTCDGNQCASVRVIEADTF